MPAETGIAIGEPGWSETQIERPMFREKSHHLDLAQHVRVWNERHAIRMPRHPKPATEFRQSGRQLAQVDVIH